MKRLTITQVSFAVVWMIALTLLVTGAYSQETVVTERYVYPGAPQLVVTNQVIWNYNNPTTP